MDPIIKEFQLNPAAQAVNEKAELLARRRRNSLNRALQNYFGLVIIIVVLATSFSLYKFLLKPKYDKILASINTTFFQKDQLVPKYKELEGYRNLMLAYQAVDKNQIARVDGLVPANYLKEDLFTELIYIISKKGFTVNYLDITTNAEGGNATPAANTGRSGGAAAVPATATAGSGTGLTLPANVGTVNVKLSVNKADYPNLKVLLDLLESSLRLINVKSVNFSPTDSVAVLELDTYYLKK
jgi:hypothetical protein